MSVKFTSKDGKIIDVKPHMKQIRLPDGSLVYESPTIAIPRVLKEAYPVYYDEYQDYISKSEARLNKVHLKIRR